MSDRRRFELKDEHLALLTRANIGWQDAETGAPEIDPKRPYGNSDVAGDVMEILGWENQVCPNCDYPLDVENSDQTRTKAMQIHRETQMALEIVLATKSFYPGIYEASTYGRDWKYVGPT